MSAGSKTAWQVPDIMLVLVRMRLDLDLDSIDDALVAIFHYGLHKVVGLKCGGCPPKSFASVRRITCMIALKLRLSHSDICHRDYSAAHRAMFPHGDHLTDLLHADCFRRAH